MGIMGKAIRGVRAGDDKLAFHKLDLSPVPMLEVVSSDFEKGQPLPPFATAEGEGRPPALCWSGAAPGTQSYVIVAEDPDAPMPDPFVHWLVYEIPAAADSLEWSSSGGAREGKNSAMKHGFTPAAPPRGHGVHHYHFQVFALDKRVGLEANVGRSELLTAMHGHVVAWGETVGTYERQ
jgi:Raf kinase inhibitor-like YbhB/YbcL family protein